MMNEAEFLASNDCCDWVALNEHLKEVRPIFDAFCARHGFSYCNRQSLGRYPRIRIARTDAREIFFDLCMELDKEGHRFERFTRDLPYNLCGGACFDVRDATKLRVRYGRIFHYFRGKPFDQVGAVLQDEMEKHLPTLERWDVQHLIDYGRKREYTH
jgi:hypothetical protein